MKTEFFQQSMLGTPAVAGTWTYLVTQISWVGVLTGLYVVVQIGYLLRKWWREELDWRGKRKVRK